MVRRFLNNMGFRVPGFEISKQEKKKKKTRASKKRGGIIKRQAAQRRRRCRCAPRAAIGNHREPRFWAPSGCCVFFCTIDAPWRDSYISAPSTQTLRRKHSPSCSNSSIRPAVPDFVFFSLEFDSRFQNDMIRVLLLYARMCSRKMQQQCYTAVVAVWHCCTSTWYYS